MKLLGVDEFSKTMKPHCVNADQLMVEYDSHSKCQMWSETVRMGTIECYSAADDWDSPKPKYWVIRVPTFTTRVRLIFEVHVWTRIRNPSVEPSTYTYREPKKQTASEWNEGPCDFRVGVCDLPAKGYCGGPQRAKGNSIGWNLATMTLLIRNDIVFQER